MSVKMQDEIDSVTKHIARLLTDNLSAKYPDAPRQKYSDFRSWIPYNVRICRELGLIGGRASRLLDLGCGAGYLMYCAKLYGHDPVGIDIPNPLFSEISSLLCLLELKKDPATASIPVIAVTASVMPMERTEIMAAGFDGYQPKPLSVKLLMQEIKGLLGDEVAA